MKKIKLCPFCGKKLNFEDEKNWECDINSTNFNPPECFCCQYCGARTSFGSRMECIEQWNHRPIEDVLCNQINGLGMILRKQDKTLHLSATTSKMYKFISKLVKKFKLIEEGYTDEFTEILTIIKENGEELLKEARGKN